MRKNLEQVLKAGNVSNPSLILHKYLTKPAGKDEDNSERKELIRVAIKSLENVSEIYQMAYERWKSFLSADTIIEKENLQTDGNIIVGLGSDNVLETGITLHHTYGVPYIPGTALKGLAAHYCNEVWGSKDDDFKKGGAYYKEIFGDTTQAGHIIFLDSWITPKTLVDCLKQDIMTPHNKDYYSNTKDFPSDYESPNPITFLSVKGTFTVVLSCDIKNDEGKKWIRLTFELLKSALKEWGVGAKTSSGYGRLCLETEKKTISKNFDRTKPQKGIISGFSKKGKPMVQVYGNPFTIVNSESELKIEQEVVVYDFQGTTCKLKI